MRNRHALTTTAFVMVMLIIGTPTLAEDATMTTPPNPIAEEKVSTEPLVFSSQPESYPQLPWDDDFVSQEGLVLLDFVSVRQRCSVRIRRPYDAVGLRQGDHPDPSRFAGYDLHEQMIGLPKRRFRVDVMTLINSGCGRLDKLF